MLLWGLVVVGGVAAAFVDPHWAHFPDVCGRAPTVATELTTAAARLRSPATKKTNFMILMMGPRVGSKMVVSMLRDHAGVYAGGEGLEQRLERELPTSSATSRLRSFYAGVHDRKETDVVGFKTEKYFVWNSTTRTYGVGPFYDRPGTKVFQELDVRVVCLARLNVLARMFSDRTKATIADGDVLDDAKGAPRAWAIGCDRTGKIDAELARVDAFYDKCKTLANVTRTLWLPYEQAKDGAPNQHQTLATLQTFLRLKVQALSASTTQHAPHSLATYVMDPDRCARNLTQTYSPKCAAKLRAMLDDADYPASFDKKKRTTNEEIQTTRGE